MTRVAPLVLLLSVAPILSCGRSSTPAVSSPASVLSPGADALAALESVDRDCLQYPVERRPDGTELWNADYVYFYLVHEKDGALVLDSKGAPLASGLLASEVATWMAGREPIPATGWTWRVMRCVREVEKGHVVRQSSFSPVEDADLSDLLSKDRVARES